MFCFEFFCICLNLASWNLWLLVHYQGKSRSKMRTTSMGYKYNTINFNSEFITKCTNSLVSYWLRLHRKKCASVNIYLLLHSFWLSCIYLTHRNWTINSLLFSLSVFSVDKNTLHPIYLFFFKVTSLCVWLKISWKKSNIY